LPEGPSISSSKSDSTFLTSLSSSIQTTEELSTSSSSISTTSSSKKVLIASLVAFSSLATAAAKLGVLPVAIHNPELLYTNAMIVQDLCASWWCAALAYVLVKVNGYAFEQDWYGPTIARKVVHILSGPFFIVMFPLFSMAEGARYFATIVSLTNLIQLYLSGRNMGDPTLAKAVSRSGDISEALGGPLIYVLIVQSCLLLFWRSSPISVLAISTMAAGDGMADLIGRKWGKSNPWWFATNKSVVGTAAFVTFSAVTSLALLQWLVTTECLALPASLSAMDITMRVVGISVVSAIVELLPIGDDNINVPLTAGILAAVLLQ
jgi:phytol kinase